MAFLIVHSIRSFSSSSQVRVRFAPSPTGYLHIGSIRTALFNYLFAKKACDGKFILRIEDTDQTRLVHDSIDVIKQDLAWFGIIPDEGPDIINSPYGPYIQSERLSLYKKYAYQLLHANEAYRCFCSPTRLDLLRKTAKNKGEKPQYDNRCRLLTHQDIQKNLTSGVPYAIRYKLKRGFIDFKDAIAGPCSLDITKFETSDPVIYKSDGFPTYHLANVVDDHHMRITHVYRGIEWLNSTPKHLMLFDSLGWEPPKYGHLPLIANTDGTKLSKRAADLSVKALRERGFEPETLITYLAVLSGGIKNMTIDRINRIYSLQEIVNIFDIDAIDTSANRLDERKMLLVNKLSLSTFKERHLKKLAQLMSRECKSSVSPDDDRLQRIYNFALERVDCLPQVVTQYSYLYRPPEYDFNCEKYVTALQMDLVDAIQHVVRLIEGDEFTSEALKKVIGDDKYPKLMQLIRCCLTNSPQGPAVSEIIHLLGRESAIQYLTRSIDYMKLASKSKG